jgi:uncharacterized membrane protein YGL010W
MRSLDSWLSEYAESHSHPTNQMIHKVCVPLIFLTTIGLLWAIPTPSFMPEIMINWATIVALLAMGFYFTLNRALFFLMGAVISFNFALVVMLDKNGVLLQFCVPVFLLCWVVQLYGHRVEGKKPNFLTDLLFLLIGPVWVLKSMFKKLGFNPTF